MLPSSQHGFKQWKLTPTRLTRAACTAGACRLALHGSTAVNADWYRQTSCRSTWCLLRCQTQRCMPLCGLPATQGVTEEDKAQHALRLAHAAARMKTPGQQHGIPQLTAGAQAADTGCGHTAAQTAASLGVLWSRKYQPTKLSEVSLLVSVYK